MVQRPPLRRSEYVQVQDGTLLAVHQYLPRDSGSGAVDVLLMLDRYHLVRDLDVCFAQGRSSAQGEWLQRLLDAGFGLVLADLRGTGASFGVWDGPFAPAEARDAYFLIEWAAARPWSSGRVGLIGRSYSGIAQYFAASRRPPHLRAMFVEMALADLYSFAYSGGIFRHTFAQNWTARVEQVDQLLEAVPVDADTDRKLLRTAQRQHARNRDVHDMFFALPYRDSRAQDESRELIYQTRSPLANSELIGNVPIFHYAGWMDVWTRDALVWRENLNGSQRMMIGPWAHGGGIDESLAALQTDWFRTCFAPSMSVVRESPIRFLPMNASVGVAWREESQWPPTRARMVEFCLVEGHTETVRSVNDGRLAKIAEPVVSEDQLVVDVRASSGSSSRWSNVYGREFGYPDMTTHAQICLTYTSDYWKSASEIAGHPLLELWITCGAPDIDVFAYLLLVHPDGFSEYLTEGCLRASHRAICTPPYRAPPVPYHPSTFSSLEYRLCEPVKLSLDLLPVAAIVPVGFRLRLCVACADFDNALGLRPPAGTVLRVHRGAQFSSKLQLPLISD